MHKPIKNIFVSYFVVTAFIYMTVTAWTKVLKVGANSISDDTEGPSKGELLFLAGILVFITGGSLLGVWYLDKNSTQIDHQKVEQIEEALEYMEMLD
jgi:H+/Cl- antiporter ClcA